MNNARDYFDVLGIACITHTFLLYYVGFDSFQSAIDQLSLWVLSWRNLFLDLPVLGGIFLVSSVAMNLPLNRRTQLKQMPIVNYLKARSKKDKVVTTS